MSIDSIHSRSGITIQTARNRLSQEIKRAFTQDDPVLIEALPSVGKSRGVVEWAAESREPLTIFTSRNDLFDQYISWCREFRLTPRKLPSFHDDCTTANGEYGGRWKTDVRKIYQKSGLLPGEIHSQAKTLFGQELPCSENGTCPYVSNRDFDPDDYDVLIGGYQHAYVPTNIKQRYVAIDEFPEGAFLTTHDSKTVNGAVSSYLAEHDSLPFSYVGDLEDCQRDPSRRQDGLLWFNTHNPGLKRDVTGTAKSRTGSAHAQAPSMAYAILAAEPLENSWEYAELPNGQRAVRDPKERSLTILSPPPLGGAEGVVALDGTPTIEQWSLLLGESLRQFTIMSDEEKGDFLTGVLNLDIIQTVKDDVAKPYLGGGGVTAKKDLVLIETISDREQCRPALITSRAALRKYNQKGLSRFVGETAYYGNIKGSNRFAKTRVGIVAGSTHYGNDHVEKWSALAKESASREDDSKGMDADYGPSGNAILHGMREQEVLQAVMRFGRDGGGATVYVHTAALPHWVKRSKPVSDIRKWSPGIREIFRAIQSHPEETWTGHDIADEVSISYAQVMTHLGTLEGFGYISSKKSGKTKIWSDECLDSIGEFGHVQF